MSGGRHKSTYVAVWAVLACCAHAPAGQLGPVTKANDLNSRSTFPSMLTQQEDQFPNRQRQPGGNLTLFNTFCSHFEGKLRST